MSNRFIVVVWVGVGVAVTTLATSMEAWLIGNKMGFGPLAVSIGSSLLTVIFFRIEGREVAAVKLLAATSGILLAVSLLFPLIRFSTGYGAPTVLVVAAVALYPTRKWPFREEMVDGSVNRRTRTLASFTVLLWNLFIWAAAVANCFIATKSAFTVILEIYSAIAICIRVYGWSGGRMFLTALPAPVIRDDDSSARKRRC